MRMQVNTDASGQDDASRTNAMRMPVDTESRQVDAEESKQVDANASRLFDAGLSRQVDAEESKQVDANVSRLFDTVVSRQVDAEEAGRSMPLRAGCLMPL